MSDIDLSPPTQQELDKYSHLADKPVEKSSVDLSPPTKEELDKYAHLTDEQQPDSSVPLKSLLDDMLMQSSAGAAVGGGLGKGLSSILDKDNMDIRKYNALDENLGLTKNPSGKDFKNDYYSVGEQKPVNYKSILDKHAKDGLILPGDLIEKRKLQSDTELSKLQANKAGFLENLNKTIDQKDIIKNQIQFLEDKKGALSNNSDNKIINDKIDELKGELEGSTKTDNKKLVDLEHKLNEKQLRVDDLNKKALDFDSKISDKQFVNEFKNVLDDEKRKAIHDALLTKNDNKLARIQYNLDKGDVGLSLSEMQNKIKLMQNDLKMDTDDATAEKKLISKEASRQKSMNRVAAYGETGKEVFAEMHKHNGQIDSQVASLKESINERLSSAKQTITDYQNDFNKLSGEKRADFIERNKGIVKKAFNDVDDANTKLFQLKQSKIDYINELKADALNNNKVNNPYKLRAQLAADEIKRIQDHDLDKIITSSKVKINDANNKVDLIDAEAQKSSIQKQIPFGEAKESANSVIRKSEQNSITKAIEGILSPDELDEFNKLKTSIGVQNAIEKTLAKRSTSSASPSTLKQLLNIGKYKANELGSKLLGSPGAQKVIKALPVVGAVGGALLAPTMGDAAEQLLTQSFGGLSQTGPTPGTQEYEIENPSVKPATKLTDKLFDTMSRVVPNTIDSSSIQNELNNVSANYEPKRAEEVKNLLTNLNEKQGPERSALLFSASQNPKFKDVIDRLKKQK